MDEKTLIAAIEQGNVEKVKTLLEQGVSADARILYSNTGLFAAHFPHLVKPEELRHGTTALQLAAGRGDQAVVQLLLEHGAEINAVGPSERSALLNAIIGKSAEIVQLLLEHGADPNQEFAFSSPLMAAVMEGEVEMVQAFLEYGANVNAMGRFGPPLYRAIRSDADARHLEIIRMLLAYGADPMLSGPGGDAFQWADMIAQISGRTDLLELLQDPTKERTLHEAALMGDVGGIERALASGAEINAGDGRGNAPLALAVRAGRSQAVQRLLERGADPNLLIRRHLRPGTSRQPLKSYPLIVAAEGGFLDIVKRLLDHGAAIDAAPPPPPADLSFCGAGTALVVAALNQRREVVAFLLAQGVDLKAGQNQGEKALAATLSRQTARPLPIPAGHELSAEETALLPRGDIITLLLDHGVDVRADGERVVIRAAGRGVETLRLLLDRGGDPNARGGRGMTPLLIALNCGRDDNVRLLLERGADVDLADDDGFTPLMHAVQLNADEMTKLLLEHGAKVDAVNRSGDTALALAGLLGSKEACALLLDHGANINATNLEGCTVLMQTIDDRYKPYSVLGERPPSPPMIPRPPLFPTGRPDIVRLLIERGADIHARSNDGVTALKLAIDGRFPKVVEILKKADADRRPKSPTL